MTEPGTREHFLARFGDVVEHAPWVAETVWGQHPAVARSEEPQALTDAFGRVIRLAPKTQKLELLRSHPDLACGVVASNELTRASREEQRGAGLDACTPQEFLEFQSLNLEYKQKFGFPFILAVKGLHRKEILEQFRNRIERSMEDEFATAIENVERIIGFRITEVVRNHD